MSKKTTTLTFRIDDELKNELKKLSEAKNQTITETAKQILSHQVNLQKPSSEKIENLPISELRLNQILRNFEHSKNDKFLSHFYLFLIFTSGFLILIFIALCMILYRFHS